jgi:hypothetical protein
MPRPPKISFDNGGLQTQPNVPIIRATIGGCLIEVYAIPGIVAKLQSQDSFNAQTKQTTHDLHACIRELLNQRIRLEAIEAAIGEAEKSLGEKS